MLRPPRLLWLAVFTLSLLALAPPAGASVQAQPDAPIVSAPLQVSGTSPFVAGCEGVPLTSRV